AVHSSLSAFGHVVGGAEAVVAALREVVTGEGTIVMPAYLLGPPAPLTEEDRARGLAWKVPRLDFDDLTTRSGMGAIADLFRRHPGVVRWRHPVHSLAAWGRQAEELCVGFEPLVRANGSILLLGVQMDRCSALHLAEDRVHLPEEIRRVQAWPVPDEVRACYPADQWLIGCEGAWPDFLLVQREAEQRGLVRQARIGEAEARLFPAAPVVDLCTELLARDPWTVYGLPGPTDQ
ncbi:MAG: AAC(3) family N-acetyltransferase, partial [Candidatus Latescibacterota bacterium]